MAALCGRGSRLAVLTAVACLAITLILAPASSADVTIGANVNQATPEKGTCAFELSSQRPCTIVSTFVAGQTMTAPCDGTVTRFRLNGYVRPANQYRLRVVRKNADGSFTGAASSAAVTIATEGVNEYATSLPVTAGEFIGVDFLDSTEQFGLRWVGGTKSTVGAAVLFAFPADGGSAFESTGATFYYLYNADIACAGTSSPPVSNVPVATPSSNFRVVKLKGTSLTLELASAGSVSVTDASGKAKVSAVDSKAKPKLLKPSNASGGPGQVEVALKLTGPAKARLKKTGKVKVKASIAFTPTGGSTATQVKALTVKEPKPAK